MQENKKGESKLFMFNSLLYKKVITMKQTLNLHILCEEDEKKGDALRPV